MPDQDDVRGDYPVGDRPPGRNGSSPDERSEPPVDLAAVQADDELIDALGWVSDPVIDELFRLSNQAADRSAPHVDMDTVIDRLGAEYHGMVRDLADSLDIDAGLAEVLSAWRRDVRGDDDGDPDELFVDVDTALAVVARAQRPSPRRRPWLMPVAAAAAMAVIAFSGLGLGARVAEPGDTVADDEGALLGARGDDDCEVRP